MVILPGLEAGVPETLLEEIFAHLQDGVYALDRQRRIIYWNPSAERITGFTAEEMRGSRCADNLLMHMNSAGCAMCTRDCPVQHTLDDGVRHEDKVSLHHKNGHRVPVSVQVFPLKNGAGEIIGAVEMFRDESAAAQARQDILRLEQMAYLDPLTGLANRRYLEVQIETRLSELRRYGWPFGLIFMDIDHFKRMNDRFGHAHGDAVLQTVAKTLLLNSRLSDLVGRWGGEEFLALITNVGERELYAIADKLRILVERSSASPRERRLHVTLSMGATLARPDDPPSGLVERADRLMYQSKLNGRNLVSA